MNILIQMIAIALVYATPIIIAALGGLFSERSGVVNIALEGIMMVGGFAAASITAVLEPVTPAAGYIGILAGIAAGALFSLLHAFASVNLKADQVVSGTALNILAGGLTVYLCQIIFRQQRTQAFTTGLQKVTVPGISGVPILGTILFENIYPTFWIAIALVVLAWFVIYKTPFGLRLRSCGEHPQAAASMGINVLGMRYVGVILSGCFAG
ncbi:MAG: ABC transporter permease, partial [Spirochaetaceae bacterium]|nr:ABC transporter permease [Spirochaetaceae bacterium]